MSIFKDFLLVSAGFVAGLYISRTDEDNKIKQQYDEIIYKVKPLLREIKENLYQFVNETNANIDLDEISINMKLLLETFQAKINEVNNIQDVEERIVYLKEEMLRFLNIFKEFLSSSDYVSEFNEDTQMIKIISINKNKNEEE